VSSALDAWSSRIVPTQMAMIASGRPIAKPIAASK